MGQTDLPLNQNGLEQAKEVARVFTGKEISAIYSSNLQRALQTAAAISDWIGIPVQVDERLREINQGELEGQLYPVIKVKYPELVLTRSRDPLHARPPGGETVWEVAQRVYKAVDEIAARHTGKEVAIVAHGLSLATILVRAAGESLGSVFNKIPDNALPLKVEWKVNEVDPNPE